MDPSGSRGSSGVDACGGLPTYQGIPMTHSDLIGGTARRSSGGFMEPATELFATP